MRAMPDEIERGPTMICTCTGLCSYPPGHWECRTCDAWRSSDDSYAKRLQWAWIEWDGVTNFPPDAPLWDWEPPLSEEINQTTIELDTGKYEVSLRYPAKLVTKCGASVISYPGIQGTKPEPPLVVCQKANKSQICHCEHATSHTPVNQCTSAPSSVCGGAKCVPVAEEKDWFVVVRHKSGELSTYQAGRLMHKTEAAEQMREMTAIPRDYEPPRYRAFRWSQGER